VEEITNTWVFGTTNLILGNDLCISVLVSGVWILHMNKIMVFQVSGIHHGTVMNIEWDYSYYQPWSDNE